MKKIIALLFFIAFATPCAAQWKTAGINEPNPGLRGA